MSQNSEMTIDGACLVCNQRIGIIYRLDGDVIIRTEENLRRELEKQVKDFKNRLNLIASYCGRPVEYSETPSNRGEVLRLLRDILREAMNER